MFEQNIYRMVDQNNGKEIKQILDTENNKVVWERAIPTYDTPIVPTRNAPLLEVSIDGVCTQDGTPAPNNYVPIMCNNGVLRLLNLADVEQRNCDIGYYINNSGERTQSEFNFVTIGLLVVKPNTTYTMHTSRILNYFSIMEYDSSEEFIGRTLWGTAGVKAGDTIAFTTGATTTFIRFGSNIDGTVVTYAAISAIEWMLSEGSTAKDYVPYGTLYADGTDEVLRVSGNLITSTLTGYGTYVSPSQSAGNRAYKWLKDLPNGTYNFAVDGDYEILVQWRDPAAPSIAAQSYENLTEWITSGVVTLDKESGGYGIAVRRTGGTTITPPGFDGTLYCYRVSDIQTVTNIPMLLGVDNYKDEAELIGGSVPRKVGVAIIDGVNIKATVTNIGSRGQRRFYGFAVTVNSAVSDTLACTHYMPITTSSVTYRIFAVNGALHIYDDRFNAAGTTDAEILTAINAWFATQYAAGTPVIVIYPLVEETTESIAPRILQGYRGKIMIVTAQSQYVSGQNIEVKYLGIDSGAISGEMEVPGGDLP